MGMMGMTMKLLLLAAIGLGALYVLHLLAQDFQKIRRPVQAAKALLSIGKRDISNQLTTTTEIPDPPDIDWYRILKYDPLSCALSLVCQLSTGEELRTTEEGRMLYNFISANMNESVPGKIKRAFYLGQKYGRAAPNDYQRCYSEYPFCPYSGKTMLKILKFYTYITG